MDHFISMYIDDELSLQEKILFLRQVHDHAAYKDDAVALLEQEQLLRAELVSPAPDLPLKLVSRAAAGRRLGVALAACLVAGLSFLFGTYYTSFNKAPLQTASSPAPVVRHRFIIHQEASERVEITGSFTNWNRVPLIPSGTGDYWEITLPIEPGEHRYSFIIDGTTLLPDPTVVAQEADDFGTANSVLSINT